MKLKNTFEAVNMGDEIILVPMGNNSIHVNGVIKVNSEGLEIIEMLREDITEEQIVKVLSSKYENDKHVLEKYVNSVLGVLEKANLIE